MIGSHPLESNASNEMVTSGTWKFGLILLVGLVTRRIQSSWTGFFWMKFSKYPQQLFELDLACIRLVVKGNKMVSYD